LKRSKSLALVLQDESTPKVLEECGIRAGDSLKALIEARSDWTAEQRWQQYVATVFEPLRKAIGQLLRIRDEEHQAQAFKSLSEILTERVGQGFEFKIALVGAGVRRSGGRPIYAYSGSPSPLDLEFHRDDLIAWVGRFFFDLLDRGRANVVPTPSLKKEFDRLWDFDKEEPRRVGGGTETPAIGDLIGRRKEITNKEILDALAKRGVSAEMCRDVGAALTLGRRVRPKWDERAKYKDLANLTAPQFLRAVYPDVIGEKGRLTNEEVVRLSDPRLVRAVQSYVSVRAARKLSLGDAEGLSFTNKPNMGRPRKKARKIHLRGPRPV
jgi:hypothetical protein